MAKVISKGNIQKLLDRLAEAGLDVYAPVEKDGIVSYQRHGKGPLPDFSNSTKPPKDLFFPQTEKMFDFDVKGGRIAGVKEPVLPEGKFVLFGIRPCDARAMTILDKLFSWDYVDHYYVNRRELGTIISLSCTGGLVPDEHCFCTSVGGGPCSAEGADLLLTDTGDRYLAESFSEKGEAIFTAGGDLFSDSGKEDDEEAGRVKKEAEKAVSRSVDLDGIQEVLEGSFESEYWEDFSRRCLGCGICTLLCPTCHCFDINDIVTGGEGWRERTWDSCQFPHYSAHASGHNPRPTKRYRQRNRVYHKFLYMNKNLDVTGCVGCGRCIGGCPVNIDIIEVIEGIKGDKEARSHE